MTTFKASVQYDDWVGTAAADNADPKNIQTLLRERGDLADDEYVIGIEFWLGEMHGREVESPFIHVLIINAKDVESIEQILAESREPISVKQIDLEFPLDEFLLLFKRFAVSLSLSGLDFAGREYTVAN